MSDGDPCAADKRWSKERPLRVVTAYMNLAEQFFIDQGFEHVAGMGKRGGGGGQERATILCYLVHSDHSDHLDHLVH